MGIQALTPPKQNRTSQYDFTEEDLKTARAMLKEAKSNLDAPLPGDGPYSTEGEARSAAHALVEALDNNTLGTRVWPDGPTKSEERTHKTGKKAGEKYTVEVGKFYFTVKHGRKQRKAKENGDGN